MQVQILPRPPLYNNKLKPMDSETKLGGVIIIIVLILMLAAVAGCHEVESTERAAINAGLVQKQQGGSSATIWTRP